MRAKEFITEVHDAVMYKAPHMAGTGPMFNKRIALNYPGTLGRSLVSFKKNNDGSWSPNHEEAERYLDTFLDIINNEPDKVVDDSLDEMALPAGWDAEALGHDKTFKSRLEYALDRAPRLGGGSSRVAFTIEDNGRPTVLKIAKNRKGLAQNQAEADILDDGYIGKLDIVIPLVDYDKTNREPVWIQTELAQKVREPALYKMLKCQSLTQFTGYTNYLIGGRNGQMWKNAPVVLANNGFSEQDIETFKEYASELGYLVSSSGVLIADFQHASNWGIFKGRPVVIDVGFNENVASMYR